MRLLACSEDSSYGSHSISLLSLICFAFQLRFASPSPASLRKSHLAPKVFLEHLGLHERSCCSPGHLSYPDVIQNVNHWPEDCQAIVLVTSWEPFPYKEK